MIHGVTWLSPQTFRVRSGWRTDTAAAERITHVRGTTASQIAGRTVRDWTARVSI